MWILADYQEGGSTPCCLPLGEWLVVSQPARRLRDLPGPCPIGRGCRHDCGLESIHSSLSLCHVHNHDDFSFRQLQLGRSDPEQEGETAPAPDPAYLVFPPPSTTFTNFAFPQAAYR